MNNIIHLSSMPGAVPFCSRWLAVRRDTDAEWARGRARRTGLLQAWGCPCRMLYLPPGSKAERRATRAGLAVLRGLERCKLSNTFNARSACCAFNKKTFRIKIIICFQLIIYFQVNASFRRLVKTLVSTKESLPLMIAVRKATGTLGFPSTAQPVSHVRVL